MSEITKRAVAGTLESSDVFVAVEPDPDGLVIEIDSVVMEQFGGEIRAAVEETLKEQGVTKARVTLTDRGALDCVIRARVETAVNRGREEA